MPASRDGTNVRMGELAVRVETGRLHTLLGSCIGLVLHDRRRRIGGLAHIVLPQSRGPVEFPAKFVDTAVPALVAAIAEAGGDRLSLEARFAGGANMFGAESTSTIGADNARAVEALLLALRIPVVGRHCGGDRGRRLSFELESGSVLVEHVGSDERVVL
jgi:chemotaxis protein CheD